MGADVTSLLLYSLCAAVYGALCAFVVSVTRSDHVRIGFADLGFAAALAMTGAWAATCAASSYAWGFSAPLEGIAGALDLLRAAAWYGFVLRLYSRSFGGKRGHTSTFAIAGGIAVLLSGLVLLFDRAGPDSVSLWSGGIMMRLLLAISQLLLLENLYVNTPADARWHINLVCVALGGVCVYDVVLSADSVLFRRLSPALLDGRVAAMVLVTPLLVLAGLRNRQWKLDIHMSRAAAFHSATLVASGIFLLALAAAGEMFRHFAASWGGVAETSLIFAGITTVAVLLTSGSARSQINTLLVTHFFPQRYDYRHEWLRCIDTLSETTDTYNALHTRLIRTVAQIVDSPGGMLFLQEGDGFHWAGSWNMPAATLSIPANHALLPLFASGDTTIELDRHRQGMRLPDELARAWLAIPLGHRGLLTGFVLVARSRAPFRLDAEVAGLLRIVGREVAAYIAEHRATQSLLETRQLRDYSKRFAFVAHDIKNVSGQLSLLLSNAKQHMQNPEFQHDLLATVEASVHKIGMLLKRLQPSMSAATRSVIAPVEQLDTILERYQRARRVTIELESDGRTGEVVMDGGAFEAVVTHLLDNAVEAAGAASPIHLQVRHDVRRMLIDIVDSGPGMAPDFVRDRLFQPFTTSKLEGSGIGAFQARELLREAGGDLIVLSAPGQGTTMRLLMPLVESAAPGVDQDPRPTAFGPTALGPTALGNGQWQGQLRTVG